MLAAERGAAKNTLDAYRRDLEDTAGRLLKRKKLLEEAETDDLRTLFSQFSAAGLAPSTAARKRAALRQFYIFLQAEKLRKDNPVDGLDAPKQKRPLPKTLSIAEVDKLIATAFERVEQNQRSGNGVPRAHQFDLQRLFAEAGDERRATRIEKFVLQKFNKEEEKTLKT